MQRLRNELKRYAGALRSRGWRGDLSELVDLDETCRQLRTDEDELLRLRRSQSDRVGHLKRQGRSADDVVARAVEVSAELAEVRTRRRHVQADLEAGLAALPNTPDPSAPLGDGPEHDVCMTHAGPPVTVSARAAAHWDVMCSLGLVDQHAASRAAGHGFALWRGRGARLRRALGAFALDLHLAAGGWEEVALPALVNDVSATHTGHLPRMRPGMYAVAGSRLFLTPKAEVALLAMDRDRVTPVEDLPVRRVAFAQCLRRRAASGGKAERGLIRLHEFGAVELASLVAPASGLAELELLLGRVEDVLCRLDVPYRVMHKCTGSLSFAAAKAYRIDAWAPGSRRWLTVGTAAWFRDFQTRRANIRCRDTSGRLAYCHSANATAPAVERLLAVLLEVYQQPDGSVVVPAALRPHMPGCERIY